MLALAVVVGFTPAIRSASALQVCAIYVANIGSNDVTVVDTATNSVVTTVSVGSGPDGVAASPDGSLVYVANAFSNSVSVIDTATNVVTASIPVGQNPIGLRVTPDGTRAYVANFATPGSVSVIDTLMQTVTSTIPVDDGPSDVVITPDGSTAYVVGGLNTYVSIVATVTNTVTGKIVIGGTPQTGAITPDGGRLYVTGKDSGNLSVIDTATNTITATLAIGPNPIDLAITPNGARVYVANIGFSSTGTVSVIDATTNTVSTTIPLGNHPDGVVVTPDGASVYVGTTGCCGGPTTVSVISTATNTVTATAPVGTNPNAVAIACRQVAPSPTVTPAPGATTTPAPTNTPTLAPPSIRDTDGDGIVDASDNCPNDFNPAQSDGNHNATGDMCDTGTPAPLTLSRVHLKTAPHGSLSVRAKLDGTEWISLPDAFAGGLTVGVIGVGLPAPEVLSFPGTRCVALSLSRITCVGTRAETARFSKLRKGNIFNVTLAAKNRTFSPPLTNSGVQVVLSTGGLDRRDTTTSCKVPRSAKSATCRK